VRIRAATAQDDAALRALDRATWTPDVSPAPRPAPGKPFFGPDCPPTDLLVAVLEGEVVGYIRLGRATALESNRHVVAITGLAVDPARRRLGIGVALIRAASREATTRAARRLTLRVLAPNVAARALYERCGFETEGVLRAEFLLDGRYVDDVLMALELPVN
jgi:ribosomal protein S18 acetylase RimI-like enzyme